MKRALLAAATLLALAAPALAQRPSAPGPVTYQKTQHIDIGEDEEVIVDNFQPDSHFEEVLRRAHHVSLIPIRHTLLDAMIRSVERF